MPREDTDLDWAVTETDRGTGMTCPRDECGGKMLVNLDELRKVKGRDGLRSVVCPFCECASLLPAS